MLVIFDVYFEPNQASECDEVFLPKKPFRTFQRSSVTDLWVLNGSLDLIDFSDYTSVYFTFFHKAEKQSPRGVL